jgi:uncharacterized protein (DUF58 family)
MAPTNRSALVIALLALSALVLPGALVAVLLAAALGASAADAWMVRRAPPLDRRTATVLSRGVPSAYSAEARATDRRRVLMRQPLAPGLAAALPGGETRLVGSLTAWRRGRFTLPGVASASVGPLGLGRWHHAPGPPADLRVYPDVVNARRLVLRMRQGRATREGLLQRGPLGLGTDFESVRDYSPDDDVRQVNWSATARLGRPMSNQYRVEQDRDVVFLVDVGRLMGAPATGDRSLLDGALDAVAAVAAATEELGDRCGAIVFDDQIRRVVGPQRRGARPLIETVFDIQASTRDSDFERAFLRVGSARRALVMVFTDLIDEAAARSLVAATPMLARRHAVVVASIADADLDGLASRAPAGTADAYRMAAALTVLDAREAATARLRRVGADVVQAPAELLPERCLQAYLRAKARVRL